MIATDPGKAYRQPLIQGGSLPEVFIHAYDQVASLLYSAARAVKARDIEKKTEDLNRALAIIFHLQGALNFETGGEVAQTLNRFYVLIQQEIIKGSGKMDAEMLCQAAAHVNEVRKVWEQSLAIAPETQVRTESDALSRGQTHKPSVTSIPADPLSQESPSGSWTA